MTDFSDEDKTRFFDLAWNDAGLRRTLQRGIAKAHPEIEIPEVELESQIAAASKAAEDRVAKLEADLQAERAARESAEQINHAKSAHGLSDEELSQVTQTMLKEGITSLDTGLKFTRLEAEHARANEPMQDRMSMRPAPDFKDWLKDRRGMRRKALLGALSSLRENQRRADFLSTV